MKTNTQAVVATNTKNSYLALLPYGKVDKTTNVSRVKIHSISLSQPSTVVTIHRRSQQLQLQVLVGVSSVSRVPFAISEGSAGG